MTKRVQCDAPGKIIMFGEHAVVHGKQAIACAVDGRITVDVVTTNDNSIKFNMNAITENTNIQIQLIDINKLLGSKLDEENMKKEVKSVITKLFGHECMLVQNALCAAIFGYVKIFSKDQMSLSIDVGNENLPIGAGLGSSAAYNVSMATAFLIMAGCITPESDGHLDGASLALINKHAFSMETMVHGNPSGIDNSVSTYGGAVTLQSGCLTRMHNFPKVRFLVTDTKVTRNTKALVGAVHERLQQHPTLVGHVFNAIHQISLEAEEVFQHWDEDGKSSQERLKTLLSMNHHLLNSIGVGHPRLDEIHGLSTELGFACKLTGAGGGGCAITLIDPGADGAQLGKLRDRLTQHGFTTREATLGCDGVHVGYWGEGV